MDEKAEEEMKNKKVQLEKKKKVDIEALMGKNHTWSLVVRIFTGSVVPV